MSDQLEFLPTWSDINHALFIYIEVARSHGCFAVTLFHTFCALVMASLLIFKKILPNNKLKVVSNDKAVLYTERIEKDSLRYVAWKNR